MVGAPVEIEDVKVDRQQAGLAGTHRLWCKNDDGTFGTNASALEIASITPKYWICFIVCV